MWPKEACKDSEQGYCQWCHECTSYICFFVSSYKKMFPSSVFSIKTCSSYNDIIFLCSLSPPEKICSSAARCWLQLLRRWFLMSSVGQQPVNIQSHAQQPRSLTSVLIVPQMRGMAHLHPSTSRDHWSHSALIVFHQSRRRWEGAGGSSAAFDYETERSEPEVSLARPVITAMLPLLPGWSR